jgi:endoglucanase
MFMKIPFERWRHERFVAAFVIALICGRFAAQDATPPADAAPAHPTPGSFADLGRGLNLGNYLENPHPDDWKIRFDLRDYARIRSAGFTNVRIPLNFSAHAGAAPDYTIDPKYLQRVDENLQAAHAAGLKIIIDDHNERELMADPETNTRKFLSEWKQAAEHFKDLPATIYFELLNEPTEKMDAKHWNALQAKVLPVIRQTNPDRPVIIDAFWGGSYAAVPSLVPADDRHLIVSFHYYDPMEFTHQGAAFVKGASAWLGTTWTGTAAEQKAVKDAFDKVAAWAEKHHRQIYVGEFGTYLKGDLKSRAAWASFVARTCEAHDYGWSYYDYASGFGVCDPQTHQWIEPILHALQPRE